MTGREVCPICGTFPHASVCPLDEWPRRMTPRLLATRVLVGLVCFFLLTAVAAPSYGWQLALVLSALACTLLYATLRFTEQPTVVPARVTPKRPGCCGYEQ